MSLRFFAFCILVLAPLLAACGGGSSGPPAPTVTGVTPDRGLTDGGTALTITGTGFLANAAGQNTVTIGGASATNVVVISDATITCDTPMGMAGPADVVVSNDNGAGGLADGFLYTEHPQVLLVYAVPDPDFATDVVDKLAASGFFAVVDGFDAEASTPTLPVLQMYDAVVIMSDTGFADPAALGDVLADYLDGGGGVVMAQFYGGGGSTTPAGRFATDGYYALEPGGAFTAGDGPWSLNPLVAHPILTGVATFSGGTSSYRMTGGTLAAGATVLGEWTDGSNTPLIVVRSVGGVRRCDLNFYPPTDDTGRVDFVDATTDAMRVVANALLWVSERI